jgi:L-iditol 2-dehydrogenase
MSFEDATMIEPLGCVIAGQRQIRLKKCQTVLIIGSGVSGILHLQLAKTKGLRVIATDINEYRLRKAIEFGADCVFHADTYSADDLKGMNDDRLADVVIVCAAAEKAVEDALSSIDRKGRILFFAVPRTHIMLPSIRFWRDEMTVTFSYGAAPSDIQNAIKMIHSKKIDVGGMITHRIPFSDIKQGFRLASEAKESLKVIVVPDNDM